MSSKTSVAGARQRVESESNTYRPVDGYRGVLIPLWVKDELEAEKEAALIEENEASEMEDEGWSRKNDVDKVVEQLTACVPPSKRMIKVFEKINESEIKTKVKRFNSDARERLTSCFKAMANDEGLREMPTFKGIKKTLTEVKKSFGNFDKVIDEYIEELSLAGASTPESMRVAPVILDGDPGVGKTAFAQAFAKALDIPFLKVSAGGLQHAAVFTGTAMHWSNTQAGEVFNMLGFGTSASGVILIDEVDKLNDQSYNQILPALLDLLEPETSREYRDESLGISFDASHLIIVMTSNVLENINEALLSRCKVFNIEMPGFGQKMAVAAGEHKKINDALPKAKRTQLDINALELAVKADMDIRALIIAVRKSCAVALSTGSRIAVPVFEMTDKSKKKHPFGFLPGE